MSQSFNAWNLIKDLNICRRTEQYPKLRRWHRVTEELRFPHLLVASGEVGRDQLTLYSRVSNLTELNLSTGKHFKICKLLKQKKINTPVLFVSPYKQLRKMEGGGGDRPSST